jgi:hypothetical protein
VSYALAPVHRGDARSGTGAHLIARGSWRGAPTYGTHPLQRASHFRCRRPKFALCQEHDILWGVALSSEPSLVWACALAQIANDAEGEARVEYAQDEQ